MQVAKNMELRRGRLHNIDALFEVSACYVILCILHRYVILVYCYIAFTSKSDNAGNTEVQSIENQARSYVQARLHEEAVASSFLVKIVATRCQILWLKCTKFDFGWGSDPDPAGGAYSAAQTLYLRGPTSKRREGRGRSTCLPPRFDNTCYGPESYPAFCDTRAMDRR